MGASSVLRCYRGEGQTDDDGAACRSHWGKAFWRRGLKLVKENKVAMKRRAIVQTEDS